MSNKPFEIITEPFSAYIAAVDTAFPLIGVTPSASWNEMGTNGKRNMVEGGVTLTLEQSLVEHRVEGGTGPIKVSRTSEGLKVSFALADLSPEFLSYIIQGSSPTSQATSGGEGAFDWIGLYRGLDVAEYALLLVGPSPLNTGTNTWKCHFEIPRCVQSGNVSPVFSKSGMAGLQFEFTALEDPSAAAENRRFGRFRAQDGSA